MKKLKLSRLKAITHCTPRIEILPFKTLPETTHPEDDARIVKAAVQVADLVYVGWRHSEIIQRIAQSIGTYTGQEAQGFVDQYGNFYNRYMASKVAARARQAPMRHGTLLSEQLWDSEGKPTTCGEAYDPGKP